MSETTQEERDHARSSWNEHPSSERGDIWKRLLNDADRLAEIERQVIYRIESMPPDAILWVKISRGMCQVRDCDGNGIPWVDYRPDHEGPVCLPIIDVHDAGKEDE